MKLEVKFSDLWGKNVYSYRVQYPRAYSTSCTYCSGFDKDEAKRRAKTEARKCTNRIAKRKAQAFARDFPGIRFHTVHF
jgi:hypothetical protein